jgi:phospholipase/lecithinase/hemolysin
MGYTHGMKNLFRFIAVILLFGLAVLPTQAAFTSLYVFGDALSTTTNNPSPGPLYYGLRQSNGRVWVEVLAQRQGLAYDAKKNNSYFDHNSATLVTDINGFKAPPDVANDLFIVWVCNSDTFDNASGFTTGSSNSIYAQWQAANNQSQANHLQIITSLYAKGVRTLILPNVVDISKVPAFNGNYDSTKAKFLGEMHYGCIDYNAKFSNAISQAKVLCPNLKIYTPDFFTLLNNVLTNAAYYGLTNVLKNGVSIDALDDPQIFNTVATNGPGTNYVFWNYQNPTAKFHEVIADVAQQIISQVKISQLVAFNGSNRLDVVNYPAGLSGFVDGSTNLVQASWTSVTNITSINTTQSIFVSAPQLSWLAGGSGGSGSIYPGDPGTGSGTSFTIYYEAQFYRLRFPYAWTWP